MLDHQHRVTRIDQALQHVEQLADILKMKTGCRLVQNVERLARLATMELLGKLHTLRLTARERRSGLAQAHIAQANVIQGLELALDLRNVPKESKRLGNAHVEHVRDGFATIGNLERLAVITLAAANLAGHINIGKKVHLDLDLAIALARLAATAAHIKGETTRRVAARLRLRRARKQRAQIVPQANIGSGIRARRTADWRLIDIDYLIDALNAFDLLVWAHGTRRAVDSVGEGRRNRIGDQGTLSRSRHTGYDGKRAKLNLGGNVFEVVGARARNL